MSLLFSIGVADDHLFSKEFFIRFTMHVFSERLSVMYIHVLNFCFALGDWIWDLIMYLKFLIIAYIFF